MFCQMSFALLNEVQIQDSWMENTQISNLYIHATVIFLISFLCRFLINNIKLCKPCRNWTFQLFARVAKKKERNGANKKSDTRLDSNPGIRLVAPNRNTIHA